jgi:hypothetical protein
MKKLSKAQQLGLKFLAKRDALTKGATASTEVINVPQSNTLAKLAELGLAQRGLAGWCITEEGKNALV